MQDRETSKKHGITEDSAFSLCTFSRCPASSDTVLLTEKPHDGNCKILIKKIVILEIYYSNPQRNIQKPDTRQVIIC